MLYSIIYHQVRELVISGGQKMLYSIIYHQVREFFLSNYVLLREHVYQGGSQNLDSSSRLNIHISQIHVRNG